MWRSIAIARASLRRRSAGSNLCSLHHQSQVITNNLSPKHHPSQFASTPSFLENTFLRNPRCFSHSSLEHDEPESQESPRSAEDDSNLDSLDPPKIDETVELGESETQIDATNEDVAVGEIEKPKVELPAAKFEELLSLLKSDVDGSLESSLDELELDLDEAVVLRVLETPLVPGANLLQFFRWTVEKKKFQVSTPAVAALVRAVCGDQRGKESCTLWELIKEIGKRESLPLNAEILNELMASLSKQGEEESAYEIFCKFDEFQCVPDSDTYFLAIEALGRRYVYCLAPPVAAKMIDADALPEGEKIGKIMAHFLKGKMPKDAHLVYLYAKEKGKAPPQKAVQALIDALASTNDTVYLALETLDDLSTKTRRHSLLQYTHVIEGLCKVNNVPKAKRLVNRMTESGPRPGARVFNSIINGLVKAGEIEEAIATLRVVEKRGLKPEVFAYGVIISVYSRLGMMDKACEMFEEVKRVHKKLSQAVFHSIIRGFCRLKDYDMAWKVFGEMEEYGVEPSVDEYVKLIKSLCMMEMDWKRAQILLDQMKAKGLRASVKMRGIVNAVKELEQEFANVKADAKDDGVA